MKSVHMFLVMSAKGIRFGLISVEVWNGTKSRKHHPTIHWKISKGLRTQATKNFEILVKSWIELIAIILLLWESPKGIINLVRISVRNLNGLAPEDDTKHKHKKGVVITARVHPGEAQSSFIVQGLIEFLLSNDPVAVKLRDQYVFKIIPMLNPDGVVYGNYRCSLLGFDLNRRWAQPNKHFDSTIYYAKRMMKKLSEEREILLFWDLHGHSCKKNVFMYGCEYEVIKRVRYSFEILFKIFAFNTLSF